MMPLSEHEQRLLNEIEQALYAEDPKFASSVRSARPRSRARTMLALSILGVVVGLVVVLVGLTAHLTLLGVVGFVLIVGSCVAGAGALRGPKRNSAASLAHDPRGAKSNTLRTKMEDRMRRRFDEN
jgi:hypothetical protein